DVALAFHPHRSLSVRGGSCCDISDSARGPPRPAQPPPEPQQNDRRPRSCRMDYGAAEPSVATLAPVSSLATAPQGAAPGDSRATQPARVRSRRATPDAVFGLGLGAGLSVVVFVATGGTNLAPNTWTQIVLLVLGAALAGL